MNLWSKKYSKTITSYMARLIGMAVMSLIGFILLAPQAKAAACNDTRLGSSDPYGISTIVRADIYDTAGNFLRHSNDFSFRVTTVDAFGYGFNQAQLNAGIAQWPAGRDVVEYRYFTKDFAVNAAQGEVCADSGGVGRRFIFDAVRGTNGFLLDCVWDERTGGSVSHRFDLLAVNDAYGDPWIGFQSITPGIVLGGRDMNDQPTAEIVFRFIERPHGTIQGYKVDRATLRDGTGPYKTATITANGPRSASDASQPYHLQLAPGNYSLTSAAIPGWRLVGYTYNSSYYDLGTGPLGNLNSVSIGANETKDIWFVYDRDYFPWLQSFNGDVVANGTLTGQKIGMSGGRSSSASDKEAAYLLIVNAVGSIGQDFCSTNGYSLGGASGNCNPQTYTINNKYFDYASVAPGVDKLWQDNGAGSGTTCSNGLSKYLTGNLTSSGGGNLDHPSVSDLADGCDSGKIWKAAGDYKLGGKTFDQGRATYWIKGNLALTGNIIANLKASYANPKKTPNLGIIVDGNITIDPRVTEIDASLFATGKIYTCHPAGSSTAGAAYYKSNGATCKKDLRINGLMSAIGGFTFGRTYISTFGGGSGNPAEKLAASAQAIAFPPPGFGDDTGDSSLFYKYLGESNPRF